MSRTSQSLGLSRLLFSGAVFAAAVLLPALSLGIESGKSGTARVSPNIEIQAYLKALVSTNTQVFIDGTEAAVLNKFRHVQKMAGSDEVLLTQLMYFHAHAHDMRTATLTGCILERLAIPNSAFADVCLPLLDSDDEASRELASEWLTRADYSPEGGVDFSRYEKILRESKENPSQSLVRYMYGRNPQAAVATLARVYEEGASTEVASKSKGDIGESLQYFACRAEWWAHLYVATVMEQFPHLESPELLKKIEQDTHPLVREKVNKLTAQNRD
jgi:hypothetical protein